MPGAVRASAGINISLGQSITAVDEPAGICEPAVA